MIYLPISGRKLIHKSWEIEIFSQFSSVNTSIWTCCSCHVLLPSPACEVSLGSWSPALFRFATFRTIYQRLLEYSGKHRAFPTITEFIYSAGNFHIWTITRFMHDIVWRAHHIRRLSLWRNIIAALWLAIICLADSRHALIMRYTEDFHEMGQVKSGSSHVASVGYFWKWSEELHVKKGMVAWTNDNLLFAKIVFGI